MLVPVTRLGEDAMLTIVDSSTYSALGEQLNFWQLMVRTACLCTEAVYFALEHHPRHTQQPALHTHTVALWRVS